MTYTPPVITILNDHQFELVEPFIFGWQDTVIPERIVVAKGYPTDGASIPRISWSLTGLLPTGVHLGAAVMHDYLYQRRGKLTEGEYQRQLTVDADWTPKDLDWNRKQCDDMFLRIMQTAGETPWKAQAMYWAVRLFGGAAWNN
jgi:hypothetical protein